MKQAYSAISAWRFHCVWLLLSLLLAALGARIVMLQVIDIEGGYRFLQREGLARTVRTEPIRAHRGIVYDREGEPLAVSTAVRSIWCNPGNVALDHGRFAEVARSLGYRKGELERIIEERSGDSFLYLRRQMPPAEAQAILDAGVPGIHAEDGYKRFYPAGEVAAHLVGFTDVDDQGQEGVELTYDEHLRGVAGARQVVKDLKGNTVSDFKQVQPVQPGKNLKLSVDLRIQYLAHRALEQAVAAAQARSGSMVILDVRTGEVLALANYPTYNPNNRGEFRPDNMRNRAVTDLLEPGSTVKPFTAVAALESGRYTPHTKIDTNPGYIRVGRKVQYDHLNYGMIDLTAMITKSSQVATTKVALDLEPQSVRSVFQRLGLGQSTGSGFPGERTGMLPNPTHWRDLARATFAFGYGLSVTPLQLAQAYNVLANRGIKRSVSLVQGQTVASAERVIEQRVADDVLAMLKTVSQEGGTAAKAAIPAYSFAGKTGTVHKVGAHGYEAKRYQSLFAGMAPADAPRVVGVVVVNDPRGDKYFGGEVAAPVFSRVAGDALRLLGVAPDKLEDFTGQELLAVGLEIDSAKRG